MTIPFFPSGRPLISTQGAAVSLSPSVSRSFLLFPRPLISRGSPLDTAFIYLVISSDRLAPLYHTRTSFVPGHERRAKDAIKPRIGEPTLLATRENTFRLFSSFYKSRFISLFFFFSPSLSFFLFFSSFLSLSFSFDGSTRVPTKRTVNNNPNRFLSSRRGGGRRAAGNDSPTTMIPADTSNNFKPNRTPETSGSGLFAYRPENPAPSAIRSHPLDIRWLRAARARVYARASARTQHT